MMPKKLIFLISAVFALFILLFPRGFASAATYYMATTGSNSNNGSESTPWLTLQYSMAHMLGGDTLIIKNGTYTGVANAIGSTLPPVGTSGAYTIIKAENDGGVVFNGEASNYMFYTSSSGAKYWQFEGIIWGNTRGSNVYISNASYIKFLRCGAYDAEAGNNMNWGAAANGASYILFENCYAWGTGRYKFIAGGSNHIIFRNCVARPDAINAGGDPAAVYVAYTANYVAFQNCIAIDADQTNYFTNIGNRQGCFFVPTTSGPSTYVTFDQCVGLNVKLGGIEVASNSSTSNIFFRNITIWDCADPGGWLVALRNSASVLNCSIGSSSADANYCDGGPLVIKNNIIYNNVINNGYIFSLGNATEDYNSYYGNNTINIHSQNMGANSITNIDPIYNASTNPTGALKYITRVEAGSNLSGLGEGGSDIGANIKTLIGTPGTLWGETGYATDTGVSMWPFPNEDLIRTKMKAYSGGGVSGNRGFCADGTTLTKYIWEYLGNLCPPEICNYNTQYHPADLNQNNRIEMNELMGFIGKWKSGQATLADVLEVLGRWLGNL